MAIDGAPSSRSHEQRRAREGLTTIQSIIPDKSDQVLGTSTCVKFRLTEVMCQGILDGMDEVTNEAHDDSPRPREVPALLQQAWETATGNGDPLEALGATRALSAQLPTWEAQLVKEAIAEGATWETIGASVGVSRQAAWDRFHHEVHDLRRQMRKDMHDVRKKYREEALRIRDSYSDKVGPRKRGGRGRSRHEHEEHEEKE